MVPGGAIDVAGLHIELPGGDNGVLHGDFGFSIIDGRPVTAVIGGAIVGWMDLSAKEVQGPIALLMIVAFALTLPGRAPAWDRARGGLSRRPARSEPVGLHDRRSRICASLRFAAGSLLPGGVTALERCLRSRRKTRRDEER